MNFEFFVLYILYCSAWSKLECNTWSERLMLESLLVERMWVKAMQSGQTQCNTRGMMNSRTETTADKRPGDQGGRSNIWDIHILHSVLIKLNLAVLRTVRNRAITEEPKQTSAGCQEMTIKILGADRNNSSTKGQVTKSRQTGERQGVHRRRWSMG
jgi:hypothetical protein